MEFKTGEGHDCHMTFQNAPVAMPILSIGEVNEDNCETTFRKDGGVINHLDTHKQIEFVKRAGVYFVKMRVPKSLIEDMQGGVVRHGLAA